MSNPILIRQLLKTEAIPYGLPLLADMKKCRLSSAISINRIFYVAEADDKTVGVYALYPLDERIAEIKVIAEMRTTRIKA